ncbi:hypothetical protein L596_014686 [Steinernema carpocapsae]|uniref:N-acetyltransferase domain-containing protein n=1 Tax=Steinernema carpocapsae TaxID=34508 RepID=A0A4U5NDF0_STECR|nr:hypothetical protein L596_014686 [Steinernema carpocapsae]
MSPSSSSKTDAGEVAEAAQGEIQFRYAYNIGAAQLNEFNDKMRLFKTIKDVRIEVFCVGQECPYEEEFDGLDFSSCMQVAAFVDGNVVGICRIRKALPFVKLERIAVLEKYRKFGYGNKIVAFAIKLAETEPVFKNLILALHSQSYVKGWYKKFGFEIFGDEFEECGIPHFVMVKWPEFTKPFEFERLLINNPSPSGYPALYKPGPHDCNHPAMIKKIREKLNNQERPYILPNVVIESMALAKYFRGNLLFIMFSDVLKQLREDDYILTEGSEKMHEALVTKLSHKINGHYSTVSDSWRYFYTCSQTLKILALYRQEKYLEALTVCDDALMKGGDFDDGSIANCAYDIQINRLPPAEYIDSSRLASRYVPERLPHNRFLTVPVLERPSIDTFCHYVVSGKPAVIRGEIERMPATSKWTFDFLHAVLSHRRLPIEYGAYTEDSFSQKVKTFHEFLWECVEAEKSDSTVFPGYLAQHRLLDQVPQLAGDVPTPDYCYCDAENEERVEKNVFVGHGGTISPMHHDPRNNFFCQIRGRKFFRLVAPEFKEKIYLHKDPLSKNSSQIDLEKPDYQKFPLFRDVTVEDVVLEPGDALFIPKGYFHYVTAIDPSISVSMWFGAKKKFIPDPELTLSKRNSSASLEDMDVEEEEPKKKRESYV